jgi:hypothetical protein
MKPSTLIATALLLASLVTSADAQRTKGNFQTNSTGFSYGAGDFTVHIMLNAQIPTPPTHGSLPSLGIFAVDYITGAWVDGGGKIPWSAITASGGRITVDISDIRTLVGPDFTLNYNGLTDFSIHFVVTPTSDWQQKSTSNYVVRNPIPAIHFEKDVYDTVETSMAIAGNVFEWPMPHGDIYGLSYYDSEIFKKTVRVHIVQ